MRKHSKIMTETCEKCLAVVDRRASSFFFFFVKLNLYYNKREKPLTILILDSYPNYSTILNSYERHATYNKILT